MTRRFAAVLLVLLAIGTTGFARHRAPAPPFFFIQMSDPQFGMYRADSSFEQESANFELVIATANRLHPAFVIVTGDLVNKAADPKQIAEYWRIAKKLDKSIPLYNVAGNHDIENTPTPATIAAYVKSFGPDHYVFHHGDFTGIVLNSTVIDSSVNVPNELAEQDRWLREQLEAAKGSGARHIVVFQHHPWFLNDANEADAWYNIPQAQRYRYLSLFHRYDVEALFAGHYHGNAVASDGKIAMVTTGAVGKPFFGEPLESGIRIVTVTDSGITHQFYNLGNLPARFVAP